MDKKEIYIIYISSIEHKKFHLESVGCCLLGDDLWSFHIHPHVPWSLIENLKLKVPLMRISEFSVAGLRQCPVN